MKPFLFLALASAAMTAAPTDEELLQYIRGRRTLERVTPAMVDMAPAVATRCSINAILNKNPHQKAKFHTFANTPAVLPLFDPWGKFPPGSLLVKEKFGSDGKTQLFTGMWKREAGYFPELGDWEFFTVDAKAGKISERGKLTSCAACHADMEKGDFVARDYIVPAQISDGRIVLHSSKAQVHGEKLHYEEAEKNNTLGYWVNPADWAEWEFLVARPGTFDIHLWQGCGLGSGGSGIAIVAAGQTRNFTVEETGNFQNFKERVIGQVTFAEAGPQTLEIRALSKPGPGVMAVRMIVLVPTKTESRE